VAAVNTKALVVEGINVFATDVSEKMLKLAQAKVGTGGGHKFFLSDVQQLPLGDNSLDAVLGNSILHHLNRERLLAEIQRVLKKAAALLFQNRI